MPPKSVPSTDRAFLLRHLPVFPAVALELIELVDQGVFEPPKITRLLGRDPALSAEILRQANTARFARRMDVTELEEAVVLLGTDQTCRTAMSAACRGLVAPALGRPELRGCWEHCVASAILATALAAELGQRPSAAYSAGLLHDIGCLALVAVYPDRYSEALRLSRDEEMPWLESERQLFGVDHCTVGRWVSDEWRLPEELRQVIVHHHDDREIDRSMVSLIAVASTLADLIRPTPMERLPWTSPEDFIKKLPLDSARALEAIEQASERIEAELSVTVRKSPERHGV